MKVIYKLQSNKLKQKFTSNKDIRSSFLSILDTSLLHGWYGTNTNKLKRQKFTFNSSKLIEIGRIFYSTLLVVQYTNTPIKT